MTPELSDTTSTLAKLIGAPTVSSEGNLDLIWYIADRLDQVGARIDIYRNEDATKANLFATLGPTDTDGGIVLSGHTDVVPVTDQDWSSDPFDMVEHDGLLYGRGACDMKGFIACTLAAAPRLAERATRRPLHFAFTYDEEVGCLGAQQLVEILRERGLTPAMAIIGEPTSMRIVEGHKGCCEYSTHFHGLEGHGSAPERGVNAVEFASRYVGRLLELRERLKARTPEGSRFEPPWTTINVGALTGGHAHNVIAGKAQVDWEMRPVVQADAEFVKGDLARYCAETLLPAMRAVHPDAEITTETIGEIAGLEPMDENAARALLMELTGANAAHLVPFGTEAGLFQSLGVHTVVCGPGSIAQAHKPDEYVSLDQLEQCLGMLERLAPKLA